MNEINNFFMSSPCFHIINYYSCQLHVISILLQVRTLFVSGLPMDAKPRELYLLFRAYEVSRTTKRKFITKRICMHSLRDLLIEINIICYFLNYYSRVFIFIYFVIKIAFQTNPTYYKSSKAKCF